MQWAEQIYCTVCACVRTRSGTRKWHFLKHKLRFLGPLLFLAYVNDIWRNMASTIRLFADGCIIYRKITKNEDRNIAERSRQAR